MDEQAISQMGALSYAEHCKERAREHYKEAKKNEYLATGNFDRMKRRKKNDTSMTPRQKYVRRLRMNQDSAAAARHAQDIYVRVLENLVKSSETEKLSFSLAKDENEHLRRRVAQLQARVDELEQERSSNLMSSKNLKQLNPALVKFYEAFSIPSTIGVQADMGVQPARAV